MGRTRFEEHYDWDDIHLANLINSAYEVPKPCPWYVLPAGLFFLGVAILIGLAWYFG